MKWRTTEAFAAVMSVGIVLLLVLFLVFRSQYVPGSASQLNQDNGKLLEWILASPVIAALVGYRDAFGRVIKVSLPGQSAPVGDAGWRTIEHGAVALYVVGLSGVIAAIALVLSFRLGLMHGNVEQTVTAVAAWWTGSVSWTLTRYVAVAPA
jgi:hypothetical protein